MADHKEKYAPRKVQTAKERRERNPFDVMRRKMVLDNKTMDLIKKEGLVPRWVNDTNHGSNIAIYMNNGYDFISQDGYIIVGDSLSTQDAKSRIKVLAGTDKDGSPMYAYLMAIKEEFYKEDQEKKEVRNMLVDDAIRGGNLQDHGVDPKSGGIHVKNIQYSP